MVDFQQLRLSELISSCGKDQVNCHMFIRYLGLPMLENRGYTKGKIVFDDASDQIKEFYRLSLIISKRLVRFYKTTQDLSETHLPASRESLKEVISGLLSIYGPIIWSSSKRRLTQISKEYPKFLVYAHSEDLNKIEMCVYHLIVHRAIKRFWYYKRHQSPNTTKGARASKVGGRSNSAILVDISESESEMEDSGTSYIFEEQQVDTPRTIRRIAQEKVVERQTRNQKAQSQLSDELPIERITDFFLKPVATSATPDVPNPLQVECLSSGQSPIVAIQNATRGCFSEREKQTASFQAREHRGFCTDNRTGSTSPQEPRDRSKRLCTDRNEDRDLGCMHDPQPAGRRPSPRQNESQDEVARKDILKMHNARHEVEQRKIPNLPQGSRSDPEQLGVSAWKHKPTQSEVLGDQHPQQEQLALTAKSQANAQQMQSPSVPADQSAEHSPKHASSTQQNFEMEPSPVPNHRQRPSRGDCEQLASRLLELLERPKFGTQDLISLQDTTKLIARIARTNANRLEDDLGGDFDSHYDTLIQWLECVRAFIYFRQTANFRGSRSDWLPFYNSLSTEKKQPARKAFIDAQAAISTWCETDDVFVDRVSENLASILFNITSTSWANMMDLPEMKSLCTVFNEALFSWFS